MKTRTSIASALPVLIAAFAATMLLGAPEAAAYGFITHGRVALWAFEKFRPELAARIGDLGRPDGSDAEKIMYYRHRNAFVYGACVADAGALGEVLSDPALRAQVERLFGELNARRTGGHDLDLSLAEVAPWPASSHSVEFALDYVLELAWASGGDRKEKVCFALGFVSHTLMDNYDSLCDVPYQVARCGIGDLTFGQEFNLTPAIEVGGVLNSGMELFFPPSKIDFGETSCGVKHVARKTLPPYYLPIPVHRDHVVGFNLPAFLREALENWARDHGGSAPSEAGLLNTLRIFMVGLELMELPKVNWSKVLEAFFEKHAGTAEFKIHTVCGRKVTVLFEDGLVKFVFDLPGPWNIVKPVSPELIRTAGRRFLEGYAGGGGEAVLLDYGRLPNFDALGLGLAKLEFRLRCRYSPSPMLLVDVRVTLAGHGPTLVTLPIDLPDGTPRRFIDLGGRVLPLVGHAFYPGLNYEALVRRDVEAGLALRYGLFGRARYERYWLAADPVSGEAMSEFIAAHCRYMASHAATADWSDDRWLDDGYWPFVCGLVRRQAVAQSLAYRFRELGGTSPPFGSLPEVMVFDVRYFKGAERVTELDGLAPGPIDVEVDLFSPCWTLPDRPIDFSVRVKADDPLAGHLADRLVASTAVPMRLEDLSLSKRIAAHRGERATVRLQFLCDPRDYGYHVEVATPEAGGERIFFTTDLEPFVEQGIERVHEGSVVEKRAKMDRFYSVFPPMLEAYPEGSDLKSLRFGASAAYLRPYPIGAPAALPGLMAVESAGWYDGAYAKFRVGGHVERSNQDRGFVLLSVLPGGSLDRRAFDTHGTPGADAALIAYLRSLPAGSHVLMGIDDEATRALSSRTELALVLGSQALDRVGYRDSWALIAKKVNGQPFRCFAVLAEKRVRQRDGVAAVRCASGAPARAEAMD